MEYSSRNIKPGGHLDEHCNRKLVRNTFDRAAYSTVSTMPTFIRICYYRTLIFHLKDIAGTILHTVPTKTAFIHIDYRRHYFLPFLPPYLSPKRGEVRGQTSISKYICNYVRLQMPHENFGLPSSCQATRTLSSSGFRSG
jgi:hypothetical protein